VWLDEFGRSVRAAMVEYNWIDHGVALYFSPGRIHDNGLQDEAEVGETYENGAWP
jgi:hypothetical protein